MTNNQITLLKRLMEDDRDYWLKQLKGQLCSPDDRGVEVGEINDVDARTAISLEKLGLCEFVGRRVYLGSYDHTKRLMLT